MAELEWEKKEVRVDASPFDKEVVAKFPFTNTGKDPVRIKALRSPCGCTALYLSKREWAPGERGEIVATFTIGSRMGLQRKPIAVELEDEKKTKIGLYIVTDIPQVATPKPSFLYWKEGEPLEAKAFVVSTTAKFPVSQLQAKSRDASLAVTVEPADPDGSFRVVVKPQADKVVATTVQLVATLAGGQEKAVNTYVRVR